MRLIFVIYILSTTRVGTRPVTSQFFFFFFFISCICKIPKFWFNNQYLKKENKAEKKELKISKWKADIWSFVTSSGLLLKVWKLLFTYRPDILEILNVSVDQRTRRSFCLKRFFIYLFLFTLYLPLTVYKNSRLKSTIKLSSSTNN